MGLTSFVLGVIVAYVLWVMVIAYGHKKDEYPFLKQIWDINKGLIEQIPENAITDGHFIGFNEDESAT